MTFFGIISSSGIFLFIIWCYILFSLLISPILGGISIICSVIKDNNKYPLLFKLLIVSLLSNIFAGAMGTIYAGIRLNKIVNIETEGVHINPLAIELSNLLYLPSFTCFVSLILFFFIILSMIFIHFRKFKPDNKGECNE